MKTQYGGQIVEQGFYFSFKRKELLNLENTQKLPGTANETFLKVPIVVMLFLGPFLGLLYVMFLPFISLAMVTTLLFKKAYLAVKKTAKRQRIPVKNRRRPTAETANQETKIPALDDNAGHEEDQRKAA